MTNTQNAIFRKIKITVFALIVLSIITFLSGFLKYTPLEHSTIILLFIMFLGGVSLFRSTLKIEGNKYLKLFLSLIGISTLLFMGLVALAAIMSLFSQLTLSDTLESLEGLFYLNSLLFLLGVIGSIIFFTRIKKMK